MNATRHLSLFLALLICFAQLHAQSNEAPFPPEAIPAERYSAMMKRSPFVLPTAGAQEGVSTTWASDYQISSILKVGDQFVVIAKKMSTNERISIRDKDNAQGIRLVKLQMASDPREVSAVIELGGIEATIQYDSTALSNLPRSVAPDNPALKSE